MSDNYSNHIPADMIAGAVPFFGEDPERVAYYAASSALGVENILLHATVDNGVVFYLAVPGKIFSSTQNFATSLTAACPGSNGHQGDGNYLFREGTVATVVRKQGGEMEMVSGDLPVMEEYLATSLLPTHEVTALTASRMTSVDFRNSEFGRNTLSFTNKFLLRAALISIVISVCMAFAAVWMDKQTKGYREAMADNARNQVRGISISHDLAKKMAEMEKVSAVAARSGGWIMEYHADAKGVRWAMELPSWVSADYYESLGAGVKADLNRVDNVVMVYKGMEVKR